MYENDADSVAAGKQKILASVKQHLEQVQDLFAQVLQRHSKFTALQTYHGAHFLVQFILRVCTPKAKQITLQSAPALNLLLCQLCNRVFN